MGFIGSHIADKYIANGHKVSIIDDGSTGKMVNLNPMAKFYHHKIQCPRIEDIFKKERFDIVNHLASNIDVRKSVANPLTSALIVLKGLNIMNPYFIWGKWVHCISVSVLFDSTLLNKNFRNF